MSSVDFTHLTVEAVESALKCISTEHPRHWLIICAEDQRDEIVAAVGVMHIRPVDTIEVRAHQVCAHGMAYIMRHPDDFQPIGRYPFEVGGRGPEEGTSSIGSAPSA